MSMFGSKSYTMEQLLDICKHIEFVPPDKPLDEWTKDETYYAGLNIALKQPILLKCIFFICSSFPPLKLFIKATLKQYISLYSQSIDT